MHKRLLNEVSLDLRLRPDGPIMVKAGDTGADPTLPAMEFVRTNGQLYLPGSSLKGVMRAHAERLARTVGGTRLACDPLHERDSCSQRLYREKPDTTAAVHAGSCFVCRLFGNTSLASRFHIADAMPVAGSTPITEERNGVAIDRVFGAVAVGPFSFETMTEGTLDTTVFIRNFGLAQLGLLALVFRDIQEQRVRVGFAKSRGLGAIGLEVTRLCIRYPTCELQSGQLVPWSGAPVASATEVVGVGAFADSDGYDFAEADRITLPEGVSYDSTGWGEAELVIQDGTALTALWQSCVGSWREEVRRWMLNGQGAS